MKKVLLLMVALGMLSLATNAFALTNYEQSTTFTSFDTLNKKHIEISFSFDGIANSFVNTPYPSLTLLISGSKDYQDVLKLSMGDTVLDFNLTTGKNIPSYTYTFDAKSLILLNSALVNEGGSHTVAFALDRVAGTSTISQATLKGTVAPEPASMALVAAGLVSLPFARRFRRAIANR